MRKVGVFAVLFAVMGFALAALFGCPALAQTTAPAPSPFATPDGDWAIAWINFLFRGTDLPGGMAAYGARLAPMAEGLREALGVYSIAMLVIGTILVFYHIASFVVNTAHDGVVLGKRANQVWAPIRLVVAIVLLVPVGSGLSAGQYLVLKLASEGSALASNAWRTVIGSMSGNISSLVRPASPNIAALAAAATDMETCRLLYAQAYAGLGQQTQWARLIGPMDDLTRIPANHVADESWLYTNTVNAGTPMCGAYRFPGYRPHPARNGGDNLARMTDDLDAFAHTEAESIIVQARGIAERAATAFHDTAVPVNFSINFDLAGLEKAIRTDVTAHLLTMDAVNSTFTDGILTGPAEAGWVAAVVFIPEFIRLQESYGELVSHMLPEVSSPVFAHPLLAQRVLNDAIMTQPVFNAFDRPTIGSIAQFYAQVAGPVAIAHNWIFGTQLGDNDYVPPDGFDVHDQLNAATDPEAAFAFFARALDTAAISQGVWGADGSTPDAGNPFAAQPAGATYNPLTALIEYGRRQYELGLYLTGIAGSAVSVMTAAVAPAALTGLLGLGFLLGGLGLVFLVPVVPFLRFLFAILTWLLDLFEAIAAMPVVALAHLTPVGEGLSGGAARQAYLLWIGLLIRPILALFGLVLGFLLFAIGMAFLGIVLAPFAHLAAASESGVLIVANTGLILLYDVLAYVVANAAFKGIYLLPDQALRWVSPFVVTERDAHQPQPAAHATVLSPVPVVAQITNGARMEEGTGSPPTLGYGVRSQSALFPINYAEKRTDISTDAGHTSETPHYGDGKAESATENSTVTATPSSITSSTILAGKDGSGSVPPVARGNNKTSPYTNVPFFGSKDKPNG